MNGKSIRLKPGELLFLGQKAAHQVCPAGRDDIAVNFIVLPEFSAIPCPPSVRRPPSSDSSCWTACSNRTSGQAASISRWRRPAHPKPGGKPAHHPSAGHAQPPEGQPDDHDPAVPPAAQPHGQAGLGRPGGRHFKAAALRGGTLSPGQPDKCGPAAAHRRIQPVPADPAADGENLHPAGAGEASVPGCLPAEKHRAERGRCCPGGGL